MLTATSTRSTIGDLFEEDDTRTVKVTEPDEKVVQLMKKYDLVALPVVDDHNRLLGRITIDDVVDLMEEEAEKDYQLASGLSDEVESDDSLVGHDPRPAALAAHRTLRRACWCLCHRCL